MLRPSHLRPVTPSRWRARPAAVIALVLGLASFIVVAVAQPRLWATPDWQVSAPGAVLTAIAAAVSVARREPRGYPCFLAGLGLAAAALVLGWFLLFAIVIGATAVLILILHAVM